MAPQMQADVALANCRIHRPARLAGDVEVVVAGIGPRRFPVHMSEALGICLKYGGAHEVVVEGQRVRYPADSVSVRSPGCVWASEDGVHGFVSIDVPRTLLPPDWEGAAMTFMSPHVVPDVATVARRLITADDGLEVDEVLAQLLDAIFASGALDSDLARDPAGPGTAVSAACEFLRANADARPSLEDVAAHAGVSKFTLLRRFRNTLGTTPHAYLVMHRVNRATAMLARGASPAEAALAAGFSDQAHLGLWFRRLLGVTPARYRRETWSAVAISS